MIIKMREGLGLHIVEPFIKSLQEKGCSVHVKNGKGELVIFAGGVAAERLNPFEIRKHFGITAIADNTFFVENHELFVESWEYLARRENALSAKEQS